MKRIAMHAALHFLLDRADEDLARLRDAHDAHRLSDHDDALLGEELARLSKLDVNGSPLGWVQVVLRVRDHAVLHSHWKIVTCATLVLLSLAHIACYAIDEAS